MAAGAVTRQANKKRPPIVFIIQETHKTPPKTDMKDILSSRVLGALLVAVGIFCLGAFIKSGIDQFSDRDRVVTVRGLSEREVMANKVTWPIVTKTVGNTLTDIYSQVETSNAAIAKFLKTNGISDSEISINAPSVTDTQADQYSSGKAPYRYIVTSVVVVTSSQVEKVRGLIKRQSELMKDGIAIVAGDYNYQTAYEYTALNDIKPEMVADATKNARKAADKFAEDSESELGKIESASQGQFSIEDRDQYTPYIKKVRVVSTIVYYLKD